MVRPGAQTPPTPPSDPPEPDALPLLPSATIDLDGLPLRELRSSDSPGLRQAIERLIADLTAPEEATAGFNSAL
jgi:FXSXX-COOH protein